MPGTVVESDQHSLHPSTSQPEEIASANLSVGCLQNAIQAGIVVMHRLRL